MFPLNSRVLLALALPTLFVSAGCEQKPAAQSAASQPAATATLSAQAQQDVTAMLAADAVPGSTDLPPGHPPLGAGASTPPQAAVPAGHPPVDEKKQIMLHYEAPQAWKPQVPTSSMRKAQFILPGAEGESRDGELVIFYFGPGMGGSVEGNIERWRAMFVDENGEPVGDDAVTQEEFEANGLAVTVLDVSGNYRESMMPGVAPAAPQKDAQRLLGAVIETTDGPWFIKAVGPADTMATHRDNFIAFLRSAKY